MPMAYKILPKWLNFTTSGHTVGLWWLDYSALRHVRTLLAFQKREKVKNKSHIFLLNVSVTRLGYFRKVFATNFLATVAQTLGLFWGYIVKFHILRKKCCGYFLGNIWDIIWLLFISTSGHTVHGLRRWHLG